MRDSFEVGEEVFQLANEISRYLAQREGAADTFDGLVTWWLFRQRLAEAENKVRLAVQYLCDNGVIHKRTLADGTVIYMAESSVGGASGGQTEASE